MHLRLILLCSDGPLPLCLIDGDSSYFKAVLLTFVRPGLVPEMDSEDRMLVVVATGSVSVAPSDERRR